MKMFLVKTLLCPVLEIFSYKIYDTLILKKKMTTPNYYSNCLNLSNYLILCKECFTNKITY